MNNKTILVVEDEPALLEAVKLKLTRLGFEVMAAATGEQAFTLLSQKRPNLIWLDVLLPTMNGLEVLRKIRENPETKDIPVTIVSVSASPEKIRQAFALNVLDYIVKSEFTIDDIIKKIQGLLDQLQ